uniref:RING-type domain-containing protein n=1 Tax=Alexandrium monilatum TaxID=311494 RepID=A0A7S4QB02_9DINO
MSDAIIEAACAQLRELTARLTSQGPGGAAGSAQLADLRALCSQVGSLAATASASPVPSGAGDAGNGGSSTRAKGHRSQEDPATPPPVQHGSPASAAAGRSGMARGTQNRPSRLSGEDRRARRPSSDLPFSRAPFTPARRSGGGGFSSGGAKAPARRSSGGFSSGVAKAASSLAAVNTSTTSTASGASRQPSSIDEESMISTVCENAKAEHCPICLELEPDMLLLCCGTPYHVACVGQWLQSPSGEPCCPTCLERVEPPPAMGVPEDTFWSDPSFTINDSLNPLGAPDLEENQRMDASATRTADAEAPEAPHHHPAAVRQQAPPPRAAEPGPFYVHGRRVLADITNQVSNRPLPTGSAVTAAAAEMRPAPEVRPAPEMRPSPAREPRPLPTASAVTAAAAEMRPAPEVRPAPEIRMAPEMRPSPARELRPALAELRPAAERRDFVVWRQPTADAVSLSLMPPQINVQQIGSPMAHSPQPRTPIFTSPPPNALRSSGLSITPEPVPMPQAVQHHFRRAGGRGPGTASSSVRCSPAASYVPCRPLR